ncbi:YtxH-like protein [Dyadobacter soli]|uniref:YtxH-like protein n=1 Tax=Dyadobacter soli TaxID=659014 RepID=A0A1G7M1W6_9BACT|nr:YtxH domain-containing protein [Dyadobacter soli]SDF55818.1 YtxH-like protein [Dyadobacter soli]
MKSIRIALAIAMAAAAGLAAGILIASEKGKRTRRKISEAGLDLIEDLQQRCQDALEELKGKAQKEYDNIAQRCQCGSTCQKSDL